MMTTRTPNTTIGCAALIVLMTQAAPGALFSYLLPDDSYQQVWNQPQYWSLVSGTDDGANGYPDGTDTLTMDRTPTNSTSTRLAIENAPPSNVAGITATGGNQRDLVFKSSDFTIGDLEVLASANSFWIQAERDKSITVTGLLSGAGDLLIERSGGFSDGVAPDETITLTGSSPNTITGTIRLFNSSGSEPSYWVADKVGAFGQTPSLTLEGNPGATGVTSLRITANALGGEGAIDDDVTALYIGAQGLLNIDGGINEQIGNGNLFIDLAGTGSYTPVDPGTYTNSEAWIIGDGTVTVIPEPASFTLAALGLCGLIVRRRR